MKAKSARFSDRRSLSFMTIRCAIWKIWLEAPRNSELPGIRIAAISIVNQIRTKEFTRKSAIFPLSSTFLGK